MYYVEICLLRNNIIETLTLFGVCFIDRIVFHGYK